MSTQPRLQWTWRADPEPPAPEAAVAWHSATPPLAARLAALPPSQQARLLVSAGPQVLIVTGAAQDLPWVPGIAYATRCAEAPALWRPTLQRPDVPCDLLARALSRAHGREPLLLWHAPAAVVPLDRLLPLTAALLTTIGARWQGP